MKILFTSILILLVTTIQTQADLLPQISVVTENNQLAELIISNGND